MATTAPIVPATRSRSLVLVILAGSFITSVVIGVRLTFGLYLDPVIETVGTDRGTYALAIAIQNLMWGATQPVAGAIADRYGSARVLAVGAVGYMLSMLLMATADSTGVLLLSAGFLVGISTGAASFAVVLAAVGRLVPPERRSLALGVVTGMGSVGQFVLVPLTERLLDAWSWQETVSVLGAVVLTAILAVGPLRGRAIDQMRASATEPAGTDDDRPLGHELRRAFRHRSYVLLNMAFFVCGFHVTFIATHLPSYVTDLGIDRSAAATALALIGLFNIVGSLAAGALGGHYSKTRLLAIIYAARAVFIAGYVLLPASATTTVVFGAMFGLLWLSTVPLTSGIVTQQFGTRHSGALFGIVFLAHQIGAFVGVWMGGELADATGSYRLVWFIALGLGLYAALLHLMIDDGPAPEPPIPATAGAGLAPTGAAVAAIGAAIVAGGLLVSTATSSGAGAATDPGAGQPISNTEAVGATSSEADDGLRWQMFCPLHS